MSNTVCVACGNLMNAETVVVRDYYHSQKDFMIVGCPNCGLRITSPKPSAEQLPSYYATEKYVSHHSGDGGFFLSLYQLVQKWNLWLKVRGVKRRGSSGGELLDIGCGNGAALKYFNKKGWNGVGVEPAPAARALAEKEGIQVWDESFLELAKTGTYDLITMWHVLEHVYDVPERLQQIRRIIKPNGMLVIALPNPDSWDAHFYGKTWAAWDVPRHLTHFSKKSVELLAIQAKFKVEELSPMWFDSFYIALTSEQNRRSGLPGIFRAMFAGAWSNLFGILKKNGTSSLIYYLRPTE